MSRFRASVFRQRLPCAGLFLYAAAGILAGRCIELPGSTFAFGAAAALIAAFFQPLRFALPIGVALTFAAAQAWQYRESPAARLAARLSETPQSCEATITVRGAPHVSPESGRCRFIAELHKLTVDGRKLPAECRVIVAWNGSPPAYGDKLKVRASILNCPPQRNPGAFDYSAWLANAGILSQLHVYSGDVRLVRHGGNPLMRFAIASRTWIERTLSLGIQGTPEATLIKAMTVGDTSDASDSLQNAFRETGTFHLFSVSGLHVGIVAVILWVAFSMFGVEQRTAVLAIIPCLFFYALITGLSAASVRAALMLSIIASGLLIDRSPAVLNSVGAAGLLLLLWDPSQLFNAGFQLSFGAVTAICLIATPVQRKLAPTVAPDPFIPLRLIPPLQRIFYSFAHGLVLLVGVSIAAWLASLPLIIYYFHLISLSSVPANLLAVPLSSFVLALAAISLVAGAFSSWFAEIFNQANFLLAKVLILIVQAFASIPGSAIYVSPAQPPGTLAQLVVLDAGDGGAAALFASGRAWLFDGGSEFFADTVTLPFLRMSGVNRIDAMVLTHGDARHIGGFTRLAREMRPQLVLDSGIKDRSSTRRRILRTVSPAAATAGASFQVDATTKVIVLYPPSGIEGAQADDKAVVSRIEIGDFSALLMSDSGLNTEQWLLANAAAELPCDLIVIGRHISGFSGDSEFLRTAHPQAIVATSVPFPESERIRTEWSRSVRALGIDLRRQDETGAVTATVRADSFTLTPFLSASGPPRTFSNATDSLR